jgi:hypothetical protein|tara:strand:+ start:304 stop:441 length:138 start_codon:yes stop_codon:yes gene_type:complete
MRKFVHYVVITWAFTLGTIALAGSIFMLYAVIFLGAAENANFGIY